MLRQPRAHRIYLFIQLLSQQLSTASKQCFLPLMCFFYPLVNELQWSHTDKNSILWFSFRLHLKCHPQSEDYAPRHNHQFLKHSIFLSVSQLEKSIFLGVVLLRFTPQLLLTLLTFYWLSWRLAANSSSATLSRTSFWIFYPVEFNQAKKATLEGSAWTTRSHLSSLSLFSFSELNKAFDTNKYNWWRVLIFW